MELRRYGLLVDGCHGRVVGRGRPASRMETHACNTPASDRPSGIHTTRTAACSDLLSAEIGSVAVLKQEEELFPFVFRRWINGKECGKRKEKQRWVRPGPMMGSVEPSQRNLVRFLAYSFRPELCDLLGWVHFPVPGPFSSSAA
jgi:hypothetical protein